MPSFVGVGPDGVVHLVMVMALVAKAPNLGNWCPTFPTDLLDKMLDGGKEVQELVLVGADPILEMAAGAMHT